MKTFESANWNVSSGEQAFVDDVPALYGYLRERTRGHSNMLVGVRLNGRNDVSVHTEGRQAPVCVIEVHNGKLRVLVWSIDRDEPDYIVGIDPQYGETPPGV